MSSGEQGEKATRKTLGERIWPHVIASWIAGVFVAFLIVRVAGSNLANAVLHRLGLR